MILEIFREYFSNVNNCEDKKKTVSRYDILWIASPPHVPSTYRPGWFSVLWCFIFLFFLHVLYTIRGRERFGSARRYCASTFTSCRLVLNGSPDYIDAPARRCNPPGETATDRPGITRIIPTRPYHICMEYTSIIMIRYPSNVIIINPERNITCDGTDV